MAKFTTVTVTVWGREGVKADAAEIAHADLEPVDDSQQVMDTAYKAAEEEAIGEATAGATELYEQDYYGSVERVSVAIATFERPKAPVSIARAELPAADPEVGEVKVTIS